jgi:hypothetical protein
VRECDRLAGDVDDAEDADEETADGNGDFCSTGASGGVNDDNGVSGDVFEDDEYEASVRRRVARIAARLACCHQFAVDAPQLRFKVRDRSVTGRYKQSRLDNGAARDVRMVCHGWDVRVAFDGCDSLPVPFGSVVRISVPPFVDATPQPRSPTALRCIEFAETVAMRKTMLSNQRLKNEQAGEKETVVVPVLRKQ